MEAVALPLSRQFSLAYLLSEMALIAIALAAARLACIPLDGLPEVRAGVFCVALVAGFGAAGGLCLRMAVGLVAGSVLAVASIPLVVLLISAAG
jgi:hypothetical protein